MLKPLRLLRAQKKRFSDVLRQFAKMRRARQLLFCLVALSRKCQESGPFSLYRSGVTYQTQVYIATPLAAILPGRTTQRVIDICCSQICIILRCRPTTSGVLPFATGIRCQSQLLILISRFMSPKYLFGGLVLSYITL